MTELSGRAKILISVIVAVIIVVAIVVPISVVVNQMRQQQQETDSTEPTATTNPTTAKSTVTPGTGTATGTVRTTPTTVATTSLLTNAPVCSTVKREERFDCFPDTDVATKDVCERRGCCWIQLQNAPSCFYPPNYKTYVGVEELVSYGKRFILTRDTTNPEHYGAQINKVRVDIQYQNDSVLRIRLTDNEATRYEVPISMPSMGDNDVAATNLLYDVQVEKDPFTIKVIRKSTGTVIFDTTVGGLIYEDQFLELSSKLPSTYFYGLGEHEHRSFRHNNFNWKRWGMFSRDEFPNADRNLYGVHPMYLNIEDDAGNAHVVMLLNSNAMEAVLTPLPGISWRTTGGILDFHIFLGANPKDAVTQYINRIGLPYMPPYWALGFQLCRWGYNSLTKVKQVVEEMRAAEIPYDVQYGDIDYMTHQLDFTWDAVAYAGLPGFVTDIHNQGLKYIIILDPAISNNQTAGTYPAYDNGIRDNVFVRRGNGEVLIGKVWPRGNATFPDYTNPKAHTWWSDLINDFHKNISFDGLWIDMNEPANFVAGSVTGCSNNKYDNPPYKPRAVLGKLSSKTLCMNSVQSWGRHYDVHSLYGFSQTEPTLQACRRATNKRSMVISRSTYVSSGKYAGHWLGDNYSGWKPMAYSIIGSLEFNMFGIPYIGADICGFFDNATASLCNRWMQIGAFYTFARNHNGYGFRDQHPPAFGAANSASAKKVLSIRYRFLPYLYTLFYWANTRGDTVMRSLMLEFPTDKVARDIDKQFMWGSALMISPVLEDQTNTVTAYFPDARWYDYHTEKELTTVKTSLSVNASTDNIPLHIRGGSIIVYQDSANTTLYANSYTISVYLDKNFRASGSLFLDDGDSIDTIANNQYTLIRYSATKTQLTATVESNGYAVPPTLVEIKVYGLNVNEIVEARFNNRIAFSDYPATTKIFRLYNINHDMRQPFTAQYLETQ